MKLIEINEAPTLEAHNGSPSLIPKLHKAHARWMLCNLLRVRCKSLLLARAEEKMFQGIEKKSVDM